MEMSQVSMFIHDKRMKFAFCAVLWLSPLFIGILWGPYFDADVYGVLSQTRALIVRLAIPAEPVTSPLYTLVLLAPTALGLPVHLVALVLSCLGWGMSAVMIYRLGRILKHPRAGAIATLLMITGPLVVQTVGADTAWGVAWTCLALLATLERRWRHQTVACLLLLGTRGSVDTLVAIMLLWGMRWRIEHRRSFRSGVLLGLAIIVWAAAVALGFIAMPQIRFDGQVWVDTLRTLLRTSEFYGLFIPWIVIGVWKTPYKALWVVWLVAVFLDGGDAARAIAAVSGLWFSGVGIDTMFKWLHRRKLTRFFYRTLTTRGALLVCLPLIIAQGTTWIRGYASRPLAYSTLMQRAGIWLRGTTSTEDTLFGPEVVGYWAQRSTVAWEGQDNAPATLAQQLSKLNAQAPDYCVSTTGLAWTELTRLRAFTEAYEPVRTFTASYSPVALTVWQRRFPAASLEMATPLHVDMPAGIELVGYHQTPAHAEPGEPLYVTLFLRATAPVTESYYTQLSFRSPVDALIYGQHGAVLPQSMLVNWWEPGQVIAETIPLTASQNIPVGAYHVLVQVFTPDMRAVLPLHQNDDSAVLAEVTLGYVARPWQGDFTTEQSTSADFGGQIRLVGFDTPDVITPGGTLNVMLYWEALQSPGEDYVVFVHLLDADGQLVSSHDGPPMGGRYPTGAWLPGDTIPDTHTLAINPALPPGTYRLNVGMYRRPSLERLTVQDAQGEEQPDRVLFFRTLSVP
jgi:hypothetical protein